MTIFGTPWEQLRLEDLRGFLDDAGPEPLLWEAKGGELSRGEVRIQVCGFANSHEGGYLILGASETADGWDLNGMNFPADPPTWIASVIGDGAVNPYPDGLDTRAFAVNDGRHVAVVRIPPVAVPPCNTGGRVYERVSGRTIPVREPLRLAALFEGGEQARRRAETRSREAAVDAFVRAGSEPNFDPTHIRFGLGLCAAGYAPDIARRPFTQRFEQLATDTVMSELGGDAINPLARTSLVWETSQIGRILRAGPTHPMGPKLLVRATRDGAVGLLWIQAVTQTRIESMVEHGLQLGWRAAEALVGGFGARGPRHLTAIFAGAMFPASSPLLDPTAGFPTVSFPVDDSVDPAVLAGIARDLNRAVGLIDYEPDGDE